MWLQGSLPPGHIQKQIQSSVGCHVLYQLANKQSEKPKMSQKVKLSQPFDWLTTSRVIFLWSKLYESDTSVPLGS